MTRSIWIAATGGAIVATAALVLVSWAGNHYQIVSRDLPQESSVLGAPLASKDSIETVLQEDARVSNGAVGGTVVAASAGQINAPIVQREAYAEITAVTPVKQSYSTPREVCTNQTIVYQAPVADEQRVTGKLLGAVIGGVLGHQVGGGRGKDAATVGGAILGGVLGNKVQEKQQQARTLSRVETSCKTVQEWHEKTIGYDVAYRYEGQSAQIRLGYQPEQRAQVEAGRIIFAPYGGANIKAVTLALAN